MTAVSAPGKIHLLGEHSVVYGKPALLTTVNLRVTVTISSTSHPALDAGSIQNKKLQEIIEPIIKSKFNIKTFPPYKLAIDSQIPKGCGLGTSAAVSAAYIAALLSFLEITWDKELVNELAFEAEKVFHGTPSGGDNTIVVYGGLMIFQKGTTPLPTKSKINSFALINTGKPVETTKQVIEIAKSKIDLILNNQEKLVRELLPVIKEGNEKEFIRIIRAGERNLEKIGVVSPFAKSIIREIEKAGGAAKISGAGGAKKGSGILLCYHPDRKHIEDIAKTFQLPCFSVSLGAEGLRKENVL